MYALMTWRVLFVRGDSHPNIVPKINDFTDNPAKASFQQIMMIQNVFPHGRISSRFLNFKEFSLVRYLAETI